MNEKPHSPHGSPSAGAPLSAEPAPAKPVILISHGFQQHYETDFTNGLAAHGLDVTLISSDMTPADRIDKRVTLRNLRGSRDPVRGALAKLLNLLSYHLRLLIFVALHPGRTIVIFGQCEPPVLVGVVENALLKLASSELFLVVHNILPHDRHTSYLEAVHRAVYAIPDRLIVHARATASGLEAFGVDRRRILFIEHGLNSVEPFAGDAEDARRGLGLSTEGPWLLMFGKIAPYKGLDLLIESMAQLAGFNLLIAGFWGDRRYREVIERLVADGGLAPRIHMIDRYIEDDEVGRIFAACDGLVLPYRHIDQSGVLMLAMSLGKPVVATRVGGLSEYINETNGLMIDVADVEPVRGAVRTFLAERQTFDAAAIRASVEHLSWARTLAPLAQAIRRPL